MRTNDKVAFWDSNKNKWLNGYVVSMTAKLIRVQRDEAIISIKKEHVWRYKNGGKKRTKFKTAYEKVSPGKGKIRALPRRLIQVKPVMFTESESGKIGDYNYMLHIPSVRKESIFTFNDNAYQFLSKCTYPGGGNAIVRPARQHSDEIGIATGNNGGFQSLHDTYCYAGNTYSARELIDMGLQEMETLILQNPEKRTLYYSADENGRLGCGIFNVGSELLDYITEAQRCGGAPYIR